MRIDHAYAETRDFEKALAFWKGLGFTVAESWGEDGHRACIVRNGDARVVLAETTPGGTPQRATVHLAVPDAAALDAMGAAAARSGAVDVEIPVGPTHWGTRWMRVRDPDGNLWAVESP